MKAKAFYEMNRDGFEFRIACDKLVEVYIESLTITEYNDSCGILHKEVELLAPDPINKGFISGERPTFEKCISLLPENMRHEITKIDEYLKSVKPLKFRRQIEKNGNKITYVARDYGLSYAIYLSNDVFDHSLQWYLITNGKPESWHRKADLMEETLNNLSNSSESFADRMFHNLDECVGCYRNCLARAIYRFKDKCKSVCHGKLKFKMSEDGFKDVYIFINEVKSHVDRGYLE